MAGDDIGLQASCLNNYSVPWSGILFAYQVSRRLSEYGRLLK